MKRIFLLTSLLTACLAAGAFGQVLCVDVCGPNCACVAGEPQFCDAEDCPAGGGGGDCNCNPCDCTANDCMLDNCPNGGGGGGGGGGTPCGGGCGGWNCPPGCVCGGGIPCSCMEGLCDICDPCPSSSDRCAAGLPCDTNGCNGLNCRCGLYCPLDMSMTCMFLGPPAPCPCWNELCPDTGKGVGPEFTPECGGTTGLCNQSINNPQVGDRTPCGAQWVDIGLGLRYWDGGHADGCSCGGNYCDSGRSGAAACRPCLQMVPPSNKPCNTSQTYACTCLPDLAGVLHSRPCGAIPGKEWDCQDACWRVVCWHWSGDPATRTAGQAADCDCQCRGALAPNFGGGECGGLYIMTWSGEESYLCGYDHGFPFGPDGLLPDIYGCDGVPHGVCCRSCSNQGTAGPYAYNCSHDSCAQHCATNSNQVCGGGTGNQIEMCDCMPDLDNACFAQAVVLGVHTHWGWCKACTAMADSDVACSFAPNGCPNMGWW